MGGRQDGRCGCRLRTATPGHLDFWSGATRRQGGDGRDCGFGYLCLPSLLKTRSSGEGVRLRLLVVARRCGLLDGGRASLFGSASLGGQDGSNWMHHDGCCPLAMASAATPPSGALSRVGSVTWPRVLDATLLTTTTTCDEDLGSIVRSQHNWRQLPSRSGA